MNKPHTRIRMDIIDLKTFVLLYLFSYFSNGRLNDNL